MPVAGTPLAVATRWNSPPSTTSSLPIGNTASTGPASPGCSGSHSLPFQRASLLAANSPARTKLPPASSSPLPRSWTAKQLPNSPLPRPLQLPFANRAMRAAGTPSKLAKKLPPTTTSSLAVIVRLLMS